MPYAVYFVQPLLALFVVRGCSCTLQSWCRFLSMMGQTSIRLGIVGLTLDGATAFSDVCFFFRLLFLGLSHALVRCGVIVFLPCFFFTLCIHLFHRLYLVRALFCGGLLSCAQPTEAVFVLSNIYI